MNPKTIQVMQEKEGTKRMPVARLPTEVEYWYVLPVVRKELAKNLKEIGKLKQKEVADILGISESAVSQYLKGTRAGLENDDGEEIEMPPWLHEEVRASSLRILEQKTNKLIFLREVNNLLFKIRERPTQFLCKVHRAFGIAEDNCIICTDSLNKR